MLYIVKNMNVICFCLNFWISGNFPETAWRARHSRHAAHHVLVLMSSWGRNRLVAHSRSLGDTYWFT